MLSLNRGFRDTSLPYEKDKSGISIQAEESGSRVLTDEIDTTIELFIITTKFIHLTHGSMLLLLRMMMMMMMMI